MSSPPIPELLTLREVAQRWSVSPHTVRKWVK
jgi:transposase-like protein